jgi:alpha-D-ribose 1-methylphosphonate 5-triphosphate synthase subunit PhnH
MSGVELPGFADPVLDAQSCFRAVLDAMARPGRLHQAGIGLTPPAPLHPATAAMLLTLADGDAPVWLDPAASAAREWVLFHTGAPIASDARDAAFAVALSFPDPASLSPGTHEAPEEATTLILQVAALGNGRDYRLSGPGLREPRVLAVDGLPSGFVDAWAVNRAGFPCGIDLVLCAGSTLTALPRTVTVEEV